MNHKTQLLQQYANWLRMRNYSESTFKAYMGSVQNFWRFCDARKRDENFDKENAVQTYLAWRQQQGRGSSTLNGDYSALQWFYKYTLNRDWNVRKLIRPKKEKRLLKYITPEQFNALVEATSFKKYQVILLLFYSTGLRLSELRYLKWEHVNYEEGIIHVINGKGGKDRIVILQEEMQITLKEYRRNQSLEQEYLFEGKTPGKAIAPKTVQWAFKNARKKAGLPEWVTPHVLRHSYATTLLKNGTDLLTLRLLLGHKRLETTARYLHLNITHLKNSFNPLQLSCLNAQVKEAQQPIR